MIERTIISVDGPPGSGKTTFAEHLLRAADRCIQIPNQPPAGTLGYNQPRNQEGVDVGEVEMRRDEVLRALKSHTAELQRFGVKSLRLFGSVARDEAADGSDVDILVGFEKPPGFSSFMKLRIFLEDLLGAKVDLVTESGLRDRVRPYVEKDAIRVA